MTIVKSVEPGQRKGKRSKSSIQHGFNKPAQPVARDVVIARPSRLVSYAGDGSHMQADQGDDEDGARATTNQAD